jgi:hypothetical protein
VGKYFRWTLVAAATLGVLLSVSSSPAAAKSVSDPVILPSSVQQADETDAIVTVDFTSDQPSHWFVEWGTTTSYGTQGPTWVVGAGETQTSSVLGPGLLAGTVYHYRIVLLLFDGFMYSRSFPGPDNTVTTQAAPVTGNAPAINSVIALGASLTCDCFKIRAYVDTRGASTTLSLEYGVTSALGSSAPLTTLPATTGATFLDELQSPTGLSTGTTYFWRLVATNASGTTASDVQSIDIPEQPTTAPPAHNPADCAPGQTTWLTWASEPFLATAGEPFSFSLGSGGTPKYTVMALDDFTPPWLTVDDQTLVLSGTPPAEGEYTFQWCVVDSTGQASGIVVHIDVAAAPATPPPAPAPPTSAAVPRLLSPATIVGTASVGHALHMRIARWATRPTRVSFQWEVRRLSAPWRPISGATKPVLRLSSRLATRQVRAIERAWFAHSATARAISRSVRIAG